MDLGINNNAIRYFGAMNGEAKPVSSNRLCALLITSLLFTSSISPDHAKADGLPHGGKVTHGAADLDYSQGDALHIRQYSDKAIINWESFNIGANKLTAFHQPDSQSIAVNRVIGRGIDPTQILGQLTANGRIVILDRNGVIFGQNAHIDVGGLIATTGDIKDQEFMSERTLRIYDADRGGEVINNGQINIQDAGIAAFVAPTVANNGQITAKLGDVILASGAAATLDLYGDGLLEIALDAGQKQRVINTGTISADGGYIRMEASAARDVVDNIVANTGVLIANSVSVDKTGKIRLYAQGNQSAAPKASGASTTLNTGLIDVSSRQHGAKGGTAEILADHVHLGTKSLVDASGYHGGGDIKIGGDYLGGGYTPTSRYSYIADGALIFNDALHSGNGGRTIIWADERTDFFGRIYGRGGLYGGDGGFVETSGKNQLIAQGLVDLTANQGAKGTYLLDPANLTIYGNQASALHDSSLVSYWGFEEGSGTTVNDAMGTYNGTITGATYTSTTANNPLAGQYSLAFDGNNDHVDFADISEIENSSFTISFWAQTNDLTKDQGFFYKGNHGVGEPILVWRDDSVGGFGNIGNGNSNALSALLYDGSNGYGLSTPTNTLNDTVWHHVALSVDLDGNLMELYIDGAAQMGGAGNITTNGVRNNNNIVRIGESLNNGSDLNGHMDELRIYNSALSAGQISELSGNKFTVAGLESMSQTADIILQASNSITLDLQGDTLNMADNRSLSLVTTNGDIIDASSGTIQTNRTAAGGNVTITSGGAGHITLDSTIFDLQNGGQLALSAGGNIAVTSVGALNLGAVSANAVHLQTTGATSDITLNGPLSVSAAGNSLVVAAQRNLINNHGAAALDPGAGRWLVYSSNPAQNTLSGLGAAFKHYNRSINTHAPASISAAGNGLLYSVAPILNFTAQNKTRLYGDTNPVFTSTYTGLIDGDTGAAAFSGNADYTASGIEANAGVSAITPSIGNLASNLGYQFAFSDGTLTINKAPLTITANDASRDEKQPNPVFDGTFAGFKLTDTVQSLTSQPIFTTPAQTNSPEGIYTISGSGAASANYDISYVDGKLTVNNVPGTVVIPPSVQSSSQQNIQFRSFRAARAPLAALPPAPINSPVEAATPAGTGATNTNNAKQREEKESSTEDGVQPKTTKAVNRGTKTFQAYSANCLVSYEGLSGCVIQ